MLPPYSNEWANVVVLYLKKCPDLTSLNLQGMECLQHLRVACCESLEKVEVGVGEVSLPSSLQYLQLDDNQKLKSIPGIWQCGELVWVSIYGCPELLLQSMDVEACPKLKGLDLSNLPLKNSNMFFNLSGLQTICFEEVQLLDGEMESCINMEMFRIIGGNVQTICGIGHAILRSLELDSMNNLGYLLDIWKMLMTLERLKTVGGETYSTYPIEVYFRSRGLIDGFRRQCGGIGLTLGRVHLSCHQKYPTLQFWPSPSEMVVMTPYRGLSYSSSDDT